MNTTICNDLKQLVVYVKDAFHFPTDISHNFLGENGLFLTLVPTLNPVFGMPYRVMLELECQNDKLIIGYRNLYGLMLSESYNFFPVIPQLNGVFILPAQVRYHEDAAFIGFSTPTGFVVTQKYIWCLVERSNVLIPLKTYLLPYESDVHFHYLYGKYFLKVGRLEEAKGRLLKIVMNKQFPSLSVEALDILNSINVPEVLTGSKPEESLLQIPQTSSNTKVQADGEEQNLPFLNTTMIQERFGGRV